MATRGHLDTYALDLMGRRRRRRHTAEFRASVIQDCLRLGISIAAVALAHNLNANMLRKWVIDAEHQAGPMASVHASAPSAAASQLAFVPLALSSPTPASASEIQIELHRDGTTVKISGRWQPRATAPPG